MRRTKGESITDQIKAHAKRESTSVDTEHNGNTKRVVSTGSTLLDLAILGSHVQGGGIPGGIIMEVFGPASLGKTALLCEIAGSVQRQGGQAQFKDPEGRLSTEFAQLFGVQLNDGEVEKPDTPIQVFEPIRSWKPEPKGVIHGQFIDSSAALVSDIELEDKKDEYSRRAKLFSQELRKTCRTVGQNNWIVCFTNQVRQNVDGLEKYTTPGGEATSFYASLRLKLSKMSSGFKIKKTSRYGGKEVEGQIGIASEVEVYKSSVWKSNRKAPLYIIWDYGIDDVRANLIWLKHRLNTNIYTVDGKEGVGQGIEQAIGKVEENNLEKTLYETVINTWKEIEDKFSSKRKLKER